MSQIDRVGLFKGVIKDFAVTETRQKKLPQLVVTLLATEMYNDATEEWDNWEYEQTLTGYLVLVTINAQGEVAKCFNYDGVMEAVGWDGETFSSLAAMDLKGKRVQFRVKEDTYDGNTSFKVDMIAAEDAEIGLRKLSKQDLVKMDAKFRAPGGKKKAPATAPKKKTTAPPKPPTAPKKKTETPTPVADVKPCDEQTAYQACVSANAASDSPVPEDVVGDYWIAQVLEIAADQDNVTDMEYAKIRNAVLNDLNLPF